MTNILYLHETSMISGAEQSLLNLVRNLDRSRFRPMFVLPGQGPLADELRNDGVEVFLIPFPRIRYILGVRSTLRSITRLIAGKHIEIVHSNSIRTHIYGALAARRMKALTVWHQRNLLRGEILDPDRLLLSLPDRVICNSQAIARRFENSGRRPAKLSVVFNGVDTAVFNPFISGSLLRAEFKIRQDETVIGIASRFNVQKGHETFLKAAASVLMQHADSAQRLRFLIIGGPVFESDLQREKHLKNMARSLGIERSVIFTGPRRDMPQVYAAMDILVLASEAEACGRVVLEAMACGKPVIGTDCGGTPEMIIDGTDGLLFSFGDHAGLADKMNFLLTHPDKAREMGTQARKKIEAGFTIQRHVSAIEDIYDELVRQAR